MFMRSKPRTAEKKPPYEFSGTILGGYLLKCQGNPSELAVIGKIKRRFFTFRKKGRVVKLTAREEAIIAAKEEGNGHYVIALISNIGPANLAYFVVDTTDMAFRPEPINARTFRGMNFQLIRN